MYSESELVTTHCPKLQQHTASCRIEFWYYSLIKITLLQLLLSHILHGAYHLEVLEAKPFLAKLLRVSTQLYHLVHLVAKFC